MDCEEKTYGGCEGPDAMYVKLISSDGHEFIVKREHALTSGTIKAMLSGPGQFAENETNEVNFRRFRLTSSPKSACISRTKSDTPTAPQKSPSFPSPQKSPGTAHGCKFLRLLKEQHPHARFH